MATTNWRSIYPSKSASCTGEGGHGRMRLQLKGAFCDGTFAVEVDELSLVARVAALVPPPWQSQVR